MSKIITDKCEITFAAFVNGRVGVACVGVAVELGLIRFP